jgi:tRNA A37 threonylcarbamoyladenosine modification protein TsaB
MKIVIKIQEQKIKIILFKNKKKVDFVDILEEHVLSEKLLPEINNILKKSKLKTEDIERVTVESDQGDNFTTTRIAKAVANSWNWAKGI